MALATLTPDRSRKRTEKPSIPELAGPTRAVNDEATRDRRAGTNGSPSGTEPMKEIVAKR